LIPGGGEFVECAALGAADVDGGHAVGVFSGAFQKSYGKADNVAVTAKMFLSKSNIIIGVVRFSN
jgi:hypothetical protein